MGFRIAFSDKNSGQGEGHRIYRSTTSMEGIAVEELPEPIATLEPGVEEWEDGTVTKGVTYFYVVAAVAADGTVVSLGEEIEIEAESREFAVFTFESESRKEAPVNWVDQDVGLTSSLSVVGGELPWGLVKVSGTPTEEAYDVDPGYDIGWPANPVVSGDDYALRSDGPVLVFKVTGLTPGNEYELSFVGSRSEGSGRCLQITIGTETQSMNVSQNSTGTLDFVEVADSEGEITFEFTLDDSIGSWAYLSAVFIKGEL